MEKVGGHCYTLLLWIFLNDIPLCPFQLVYDKIPRGDLQQRTIHLRVLNEGAFWDNTLLGETIIQLKDLTPGHRMVDWHQLGTRGSDINR